MNGLNDLYFSPTCRLQKNGICCEKSVFGIPLNMGPTTDGKANDVLSNNFGMDVDSRSNNNVIIINITFKCVLWKYVLIIVNIAIIFYAKLSPFIPTIYFE